MIDWIPFIHLFSAMLSALALGIVLVASIRMMIRLYQAQSLLLASIALMTAAERGDPRVLGALIPPLLLAITIEYMLAQATIPPPGSGGRQYLRRSYWRSLLPQAASVWLRHGPRPVRTANGLVNLGLVMTTYVVAFWMENRLDIEQIGDKFGLGISVSLLVLGLYALGTQRNLIAQVMGLLVAEHGLFLAVVRIVPPRTLPIFIISLLLYILLTLMILFVLLPDLHRVSGSIDVNDQRELRG
jgi:hydrogenase-4 membrane subunit HyfE